LQDFAAFFSRLGRCQLFGYAGTALGFREGGLGRLVCGPEFILKSFLSGLLSGRESLCIKLLIFLEGLRFRLLSGIESLLALLFLVFKCAIFSAFESVELLSAIALFLCGFFSAIAAALFKLLVCFFLGRILLRF
jgi:hypothetical protein